MWPWEVLHYSEVNNMNAASTWGPKVQNQTVWQLFFLILSFRTQFLMNSLYFWTQILITSPFKHKSQSMSNMFYLNLKHTCKVQMHVSGLTGSGRWCVPLHTPSASCGPEPEGWGRLSWSRARRGMGTSAGTGSDAPRAGLPEAVESKRCDKVRMVSFYYPV